MTYLLSAVGGPHRRPSPWLPGECSGVAVASLKGAVVLRLTRAVPGGKRYLCFVELAPAEARQVGRDLLAAAGESE